MLLLLVFKYGFVYLALRLGSKFIVSQDRKRFILTPLTERIDIKVKKYFANLFIVFKLVIKVECVDRKLKVIFQSNQFSPRFTLLQINKIQQLLHFYHLNLI